MDLEIPLEVKFNSGSFRAADDALKHILDRVSYKVLELAHIKMSKSYSVRFTKKY